LWKLSIRYPYGIEVSHSIMLFEGLSGKLQEAMKKLRGKGRVTEKDVKEMMREIKLGAFGGGR